MRIRILIRILRCSERIAVTLRSRNDVSKHSDYTFEDIRLEEWYSLLQLRQAEPAIKNVVFHRIWTLGSPQLVPDVTQGDVSGVAITDSNLASVGQSFTYTPISVSNDKQKVTAFKFHAVAGAAAYTWSFGDGLTAEGQDVSHVLADTAGTERDGSGRFRVILKTTGVDGVIRWDATSVVIASDYKPSSTGALVVNRTGGYTFYVVANNPTKILLDGQLLVESPEAKPEVGGTTGNMAQLAVKSIGLMTGPHAIEVMRTRGAGDDNFAWYWEGPNQPLTLIDRAVPKASSSQKIR